MGQRDAQEQLEVAKADVLQMEAALERIHRAARRQIALEQPTIAVAREWAFIEREALAAIEWRPDQQS